MKEVKSYVENLNNYYKSVTFTEETLKEAKEEKAKINKFKKQVADYRKNIVAEYNKPIKLFEGTAKETEQLLTDTYNEINLQVTNFENKQKQLKEQEIKEYFEEYRIANNIDFIKYEQAKINLTLTASMKSLKEQAKNFIDKIIDDLNLIETQEHKAEILVEYKQTLDVSSAITTVTNRFEAIEEEKKKQEEIKRVQENITQMSNANISKETPSTAQQIIQTPKVETKEKLFTISFKVKNEPKSRLKLIKDFLENGGYDYE